jgi:hypothetical protein
LTINKGNGHCPNIAFSAVEIAAREIVLVVNGADYEKGAMRPTDRTHRENYITRASKKKKWFDKAEDLLHAAYLLEPDVEAIYQSWRQDGQVQDTPVLREGVVEVYLMLVGCAFENLLKGVHVRRFARGHKGNRISKPELPKLLKTHDVFSLAEGLSLHLNSLEADLLKRLKEIIVWRGRYPVPTTYTDIRPFQMGTNDLRIAKGLAAKFRRR